MTLIEGVGDEVTNFFIIVVVLLVGWLAWCSTSIVDQPLIRTVLILQHRTRIRIAELRSNHQNASIVNRAPNLEISEEESVEPIAEDNSDNLQSCPEPSVAGDMSYLKNTSIKIIIMSELLIVCYNRHKWRNFSRNT